MQTSSILVHFHVRVQVQISWAVQLSRGNRRRCEGVTESKAATEAKSAATTTAMALE